MSKCNNRNYSLWMRGARRLVGLCLAAGLSFAAAPTHAQSSSEFLDPLEDLRLQVDGAASTEESRAAWAATESAEAKDQGPALAVNDPLSRISERLGLPKLALVALAGLALLAMLLGLVWLLGYLIKSRPSKRKDNELYSSDSDGNERRTLRSGTVGSRDAEDEFDTYVDDDVRHPSAAAAAAAALSDHDEDYELQDTLDDYEDSAVGTKAAADVVDDNPNQWRRPNLDRLKESIRADWRGEEPASMETASASAAAVPADHGIEETMDPSAEGSFFRTEAENFAELFGDEDTSAANKPAATSSAAYDFHGGRDEDDTLPVSELRSAIEKTADISPIGEAAADSNADSLSREDAMRRIRALRESLKAS